MEVEFKRFHSKGAPYQQTHLPGSKRFHVGGRSRVFQHAGTWGMTKMTYSTPVKQQNASAYVSQKGVNSYYYKVPKRRPEEVEAMKRIPLGGSMVRVVDQGGSELVTQIQPTSMIDYRGAQGRLQVGGVDMTEAKDDQPTDSMSIDTPYPTPPGSAMDTSSDPSMYGEEDDEEEEDDGLTPGALEVLDRTVDQQPVDVVRQGDQIVLVQDDQPVDSLPMDAMTALMHYGKLYQKGHAGLSLREAVVEAGMLLFHGPAEAVADVLRIDVSEATEAIRTFRQAVSQSRSANNTDPVTRLGNLLSNVAMSIKENGKDAPMTPYQPPSKSGFKLPKLPQGSIKKFIDWITQPETESDPNRYKGIEYTPNPTVMEPSEPNLITNAAPGAMGPTIEDVTDQMQLPSSRQPLMLTYPEEVDEFGIPYPKIPTNGPPRLLPELKRRRSSTGQSDTRPTKRRGEVERDSKKRRRESVGGSDDRKKPKLRIDTRQSEDRKMAKKRGPTSPEGPSGGTRSKKKR